MLKLKHSTRNTIIAIETVYIVNAYYDRMLKSLDKVKQQHVECWK